MIKTIIFDLGGVYFTDGAEHFVSELEKRFSIPREKSKTLLNGKTGNAYRTGEVSPEVFWQYAVNYLHLDVAPGKLKKLWFDGYIPNKDVVLLVKNLKQKKELIFLSDNAPDRIEYLEGKYRFIRDFHSGIFSHFVRARKPDIKMYQAALDSTKSLPFECVFIDDKQSNLEPAGKLGMKTIKFENAQQLISELEELGVA